MKRWLKKIVLSLLIANALLTAALLFGVSQMDDQPVTFKPKDELALIGTLFSVVWVFSFGSLIVFEPHTKFWRDYRRSGGKAGRHGLAHFLGLTSGRQYWAEREGVFVRHVVKCDYCSVEIPSGEWEPLEPPVAHIQMAKVELQR